MAKNQNDKDIKIDKNAIKLINKIKDKKEFLLVIVGENGSGKTTTIKKIEDFYKNNKYKYSIYTVNGNRQFNEANPYKSEEYKKNIFSKIISTGESLFEQVTEILNDNSEIKIFDEPTANMDIIRTTIFMEAFVRAITEIRILSTNDIHSLKILQNIGLKEVFNVETGELICIKKYINKKIEETIKELKKYNFEQVNYKFYEELKIK